MSERVVGIDLGTTNSVVAFVNDTGVAEAIPDEDGARITPSAVQLQADGDPVVGALARQMAVVEPDRVAQAFKRGMGERTFLPDERAFTVDGKTWSPEELSAVVLKKLRQVAERHFGESVTKAVITVPAYFGDAERKATIAAGEIAGLDVLSIINEPTAAAIAHGLDSGGETGLVLVFDLGGGTLDVTVMEVSTGGALNVRSTGGDHQFGGVDFDQMILDRMDETVRDEAGAALSENPYALQDAKAKAEEIKKELSTKASSTRPLTGAGRPVMFTLTRGEFEQMLADHLAEIDDHVLHAIEEAGLTPQQIDTVLMVGGSARIPAFRERLQKLVGKEPQFTRNLDEDVARGAALMAAKTSNTADPRSQLARMPAPVDVASHGLGVTTSRSQNPVDLYNSLLIPAGTPVPARQEETFLTMHDGQRQLLLTLNEGDSDDLDLVQELGESVGDFRKPVGRNHPVRVVVEYTDQQLIRASAFDGETSEFLCNIEVKPEGVIDDEAKRQAMRYLSKIDVG